MPLGVYSFVRDSLLVRVSAFFQKVASPVEAPEKTSFGDIDLIVAGPKSMLFSIENLATALDAKQTIRSKPSYYFAIPYPELEDRFIQLDIHVCNPADFEWEVFHQSHGDFWNILGSSIRPFGLTANDKGLHLRIPEVEELDRKKSQVFLTADPGTVLDLLHLDKSKYSQGFHTVAEMFDYARSNRFFRPEAYVRHGLKSNDRKRMKQRDLYRQFVEDFVPQRLIETSEEDSGPALTRQGLLEEVLDRFEKRSEFETRLMVWREERKELAHKSETRQWRKRRALADEAYADAWITSLKTRH
ncbi:MAG: hypothetical protein Q9174_001398 [Haloplaca sp. 1 TL-2023]